MAIVWGKRAEAGRQSSIPPPLGVSGMLLLLLLLVMASDAEGASVV